MVLPQREGRHQRNAQETTPPVVPCRDEARQRVSRLLSVLSVTLGASVHPLDDSSSDKDEIRIVVGANHAGMSNGPQTGGMGRTLSLPLTPATHRSGSL